VAPIFSNAVSEICAPGKLLKSALIGENPFVMGEGGSVAVLVGVSGTRLVGPVGVRSWFRRGEFVGNASAFVCQPSVELLIRANSRLYCSI
jgi:hypothetical protein